MRWARESLLRCGHSEPSLVSTRTWSEDRRAVLPLGSPQVGPLWVTDGLLKAADVEVL